MSSAVGAAQRCCLICLFRAPLPGLASSGERLLGIKDKYQMTSNEQSGTVVRGKVGATIQDQLCCVLECSRIVRTGFERGTRIWVLCSSTLVSLRQIRKICNSPFRNVIQPTESVLNALENTTN